MASNLFANALRFKQVLSFVNELTGAPCWDGMGAAEVDIPASSSNASVPIATDDLAESFVSTVLQTADIQSSKILTPTRIRLVALIDNISLIESILSLFADTRVTLTVTSKSIIAASMSIVNVDIEQSPSMMSASRVVIEFEQVIPANAASGYSPLQSGDQSTYGLSVQSASPSSLSVAGLFNKFVNAIGF